MNASGLLTYPLVHDLVVGDFGREAATRYLTHTATRERELIQERLRPSGLDFLDEYRRIMMTGIFDVGGIKRDAIARDSAEFGHLTTRVLYGIGGDSELEKEVKTRISALVIGHTLLLADVAPQTIRVVLPCNTLSDLTEDLASTFGDTDWVTHVGEGLGRRIGPPELELVARVSPRPAIEAVVSSLAARGVGEVIVVGSGGALAQYERACSARHISVRDLPSGAQELIDEIILLSIEHDRRKLSRAREQLIRDVLVPAGADESAVTTIEACTDFDLEVGLSSVELYAEALVHEWYGDYSGPSDESFVSS